MVSTLGMVGGTSYAFTSIAVWVESTKLSYAIPAVVGHNGKEISTEACIFLATLGLCDQRAGHGRPMVSIFREDREG